MQFAWSLVLFGGLLILPETPRYLVRSGKHEKAAKALGRLRRLPRTPCRRSELDEVKAHHDYEMSLGAATYLDCFRRFNIKKQFTGMALQALQQLTGINFIFYYGTEYFQNSGVSSGFVIQMITSSINVVSTIPGMYAIDKWGRRPLLFFGAIGMCISQFIVAMTGTLSSGQRPNGDIYVTNLGGQQAAVAFSCIYIFFFASTWGPLAWVVTGEIFRLSSVPSLSALLQPQTGSSTGPLRTRLPILSTMDPALRICSPRFSSSGSVAASSALLSSTSSSTKPRASPWRRSTCSTPRSSLRGSQQSGDPTTHGCIDRVWPSKAASPEMGPRLWPMPMASLTPHTWKRMETRHKVDWLRACFLGWVYVYSTFSLYKLLGTE